MRLRRGTRLTTRDRVCLTIEPEDPFGADRIDLVVLSRGCARAATEHEEVALVEEGVLEAGDGNLLRQLAGHRNPMVPFCREVSDAELRDICRHQLADVEAVLASPARWVKAHPGAVDVTL